jgi:hypothetical protein
VTALSWWMMLKFESVLKDKLFYGRFEYCVGFNLQEISCLRTMNHESVDSILNFRANNRMKIRLAWAKSIDVYPREITAELTKNLHDLLDLILDNNECKLVVSYNSGYVYSNNPAFIETVAKLEYLKNKRFTKAVVDRPTNVIRVRNSKHNTRSYFKSIVLTSAEAKSLKSFVKLHSKSVRVGPALGRWVDESHNRTLDYFFIDYSDPGYLTLITLKFPKLIRKTQAIVSE